MALPANFLDELRARTPLAAVVGRRVKLARSGRNWKGNCPFHNEKSPSFYVYEDGYHCFGCGAHGDAIGFVMQSQGAGFMEAVEQLAAEAGMEVPKPTQAAAEADRRRAGLSDALEAAAASFQRRLHLPEGRAALTYLTGRGLTEETIRKFGLGWSGDGRGGLIADLARQDMPVPLLLEAGLLRESDDGRPPRELFYNRVMFPIRDRRGRVISFGGRILGDGQPKYVNGPETAVYSKRRTLYALDLAREAARAGQPVLAVEGYMDVIALHQAGFQGAVAPLGTALTEEQLEELWRLSPMPTLCFDGDAAGGRAANRAVQIALPYVEPQKSLTVVRLPAGQDPDSILRTSDPRAFSALIERKDDLATVLFDLLRETVGGKNAESRAKFRQSISELSKKINNKFLSKEIEDELYSKYFEYRRLESRNKKFESGKNKFAMENLADESLEYDLIRHLFAIIINHPKLIDSVDGAWMSIRLPESLEDVRRKILIWYDEGLPLDGRDILDYLSESTDEQVMKRIFSNYPWRLDRSVSPTTLPSEALAAWWHFYGKLLGVDEIEVQISEARRSLINEWTVAAQERLKILCRARDGLYLGDYGDDVSN